MDLGDGSIKYILSGDGAGTTFTIDDSTGDIHAIKRLDREVKAQYLLRAQAWNRQTDRPLEPESEFIVKIQDINDNEPKFLEGPYQATIPEMSSIGESREILVVRDKVPIPHSSPKVCTCTLSRIDFKIVEKSLKPMIRRIKKKSMTGSVQVHTLGAMS